ncbi:folylpolyglutamate synthase/dihydrofolate synthase family protein [Thermotoga sp. KOL6]|uniref:bifunctional folylpolyglutamate synthase/dihydrofolate synthase n=1 Tax=Thermotoga sp. KOL6 TaxID=126741 RepID=UPI000C78ED0B|nr:folylpolyglutamate synthase/dihydrofolate synthase family protein [Thermotoga sp. KOL6]PLV58755.1 bifunctional folylpolyglutamate synthase/dihydrofolate synthase [Thermotoga sp. KOL6]
MEYLDVLRYLYHKKPMGRIKPGLERIRLLLSRLGNPHLNYETIHVAGTNGKGSVTNMISHVLTAQGYRVGAYYSPHLSTFRERIRLNEGYISEKDVVEIFQEIEPVLNELDRDEIFSPSFFETVTAMAFLYFAKKSVDFAVLEVGLGGRLDATNVVKPLCSVIVTVDKDHEKVLGKTMEQIAWEKSGIIKEYIPTVTGENKEEALKVIEDIARNKRSKLYVLNKDFSVKVKQLKIFENKFDYFGDKEMKDLILKMNGYHQIKNAAVALKALEASGISVSERAVREGLKKAKNIGRFEVLEKDGKTFVLDGAHNPHGAKSLVESLKMYFKGRPLDLIVGILDDKDREGILKNYTGIFRKVILTRVPSSRMKDFDGLVEIAKKIFNNPEIIEDPFEALEETNEDSVTVVTGSLFLVGYVREYLVEGKISEEWNV